MAPAVILLLRHASPVLAVLLCYFLCVPLFWSSRAWPQFAATLRRLASDRLFRVAAAFALLCVASAAWSPDPARALEYGLETIAACALIAVIAVAARQLADARLTGILLAGAVIGSALLIADLMTAHRFRGLAGVELRGTDSNRAAVYVALCAPVMLHALRQGRLRRILGAAGLALATVGAYLSYSSSAKLALAVGIGVYLAVAWSGRRGVLVAGALVAAAILVMPLAAGAVHGLAPKAVYGVTEKISMEARAVIWEGFAWLVAAKPWLGYGLEASHMADRLPEAERLSGRMRDLLGVGHPHNAPLQIWFELGAVGAAVAAAIAWMGFARIAAAARPAMPVLAALACSAFAVWCVSHGAWQAWWPLMIGVLVGGLPFGRSST